MELYQEYSKMNELEATGLYFIRLNEIYQERGICRAILHELKSTAISLISRASCLPDLLESAGDSISFGVGSLPEPDPRLYNGNADLNNHKTAKERRAIERKENAEERKIYRINAILN